MRTPPRTPLLLAAAMACVAVYLLALTIGSIYNLSRARLNAWTIERESRMALDRSELKSAIVKDVIQGRRSLTGAVAALQRLHEENPESTTYKQLRACYPKLSEPEELFAQHLLDLVAVHLQDAPEEQAAILHRLEGEIRARRHGK